MYMSGKYSIAEARDRLPGLVHEAEQGRAVSITRRGKPVAVLISAEEYERLKRAEPDLWESLQEFRRAHDLGEIDLESVLREARDKAPGREFDW
jgi:antitoxin Phd